MESANPAVDWFFEQMGPWREAFALLRVIALRSGLSEELKWGKPTYTRGGANVFLMHGFRDYCALLFVKGALLDDPRGLLVRQTSNVQAARQLRFASAAEVAARTDAIEEYIRAAISVEESGREVEFRAEFEIPQEFQEKLDALPALETAFRALTPGRRRAYLLHFSSPKQSKTRAARVERCVQRIFEGKGLDDPD